MKKKFIFPIAIAAAIFTGCSAKKNAAPLAVPVTVARAFLTNVPVTIQPQPVGHIVPFSTVTVHSQIGGILQQAFFTEGGEVKSNALLIQIDPRPSQAALDQARANLLRDAGQMEYQQANYARDEKLFESKIVAQEQIETDKASLDSAVGTVAADKAAITNAQLNLSFCQIRAPFDGVAGSLQIYPGNVVKAPDDTLVTLNQIRPIYVQFSVAERYLPQIRKEMASHPINVLALFDNMIEAPQQGKLTFIDNTVDPMTGTIQLRATFANDDEDLWPGQFVRVDLNLSEITNAIVVPSQAVQTGQNGEYIYVVKSNGTNSVVENRPVTIGVAFGEQTVIEKGIASGETVVTDGQLRLFPGAKVNAKPAAISAAK